MATRGREGGAISDEAVGDMEDWTLILAGRSLLLHPTLGHWLRFDQIHEEWHDTGIRPGTAVFVMFGDDVIVRSIPGHLTGIDDSEAPIPIGDWYLYYSGDELHGPIRSAQLKESLAGRSLPPGTLVWSANATEWLPLHRDPELGMAEGRGDQVESLGLTPAQCLESFRAVSRDYERGSVSRGQYAAWLSSFLLTDRQGNLWTIGAGSGGWYRREASGWVRDTPVGPLFPLVGEAQEAPAVGSTDPQSGAGDTPRKQAGPLCGRCGQELRPEDRFCSQCGARKSHA
jgi:hypothetical protein